MLRYIKKSKNNFFCWSFGGDDSVGVSANEVVIVVLICNCNGHGSCSFDKTIDNENFTESFKQVECQCDAGWEGLCYIPYIVLFYSHMFYSIFAFMLNTVFKTFSFARYDICFEY